MANGTFELGQINITSTNGAITKSITMSNDGVLTSNAIIGTSTAFYYNSNIVAVDTTIPTGYNAMSAGTITVADGVVVTVGDNSEWTIV